MQKRYPFKYLDAYTRNDKDFYFGRDEEVKQLYEMTFQSDLLLVYGASGTGKTSLIQCGLANCFESHDWLVLTVRRGANINISLEKTLNEAIGNETEYFDDELENETDNSPLAKKIKTLWLKYFKPVYLIFDQFEEIYTVNNNESEQLKFYETVRNILLLNQPVKIIIIIREEYYGHLYDFEKIVPDIYRKKLRIEPMTLDKVRQVLQGINNPAKSKVTLQTGKENELIQVIFDKLREENKVGIDLAYLQILLDNLYLSETGDEQRQTETALTISALNEIGAIGDILFGLLDGLYLQLETDKNIAIEKSKKMLSHFVTEKGTKEPLSISDLQKQMPEIDEKTLSEFLDFFVKKRILRFYEKENRYEIAHDKLAEKINAKLSPEDKVRKETKKLIRNKLSLGEFFSEKQLLQIEMYFDEQELAPEEKDWMKLSRKEAEKVEKQKRRTLRITQIAFVMSVLFLFFAGWQWQRAEKLINAFYFYNDKYALAYGEYEKNNSYGNIGFYFIDKSGTVIDTLGYWQKAEPFDMQTGLAKVIDFRNGVYILDTLGNRYKCSNSIDGLAHNDNGFYFTDKNGVIIETLGYWQKAKQFDKNRWDTYYGYAKVVDFDDKMYLLDTLGNRYRYSDNINDLANDLQILDLSNRYLGENLPSEIWTLTNLRELNLKHNSLESLPPEIGNLINLTKLTLQYNQIKTLPAEISKLKNLKDLDLYGCKLDSLSPEIGELINLEKLDLQNSGLKNLPDEIGQLANLRELDLSGDSLKTLPATIGNLKKLTKLDLRDNQLYRLPREIWTLSNLTELYLGVNSWLERLPSEIGNLKNLTKLDVHYLNFALRNLTSEIWTLPNLTELNLSGSSLKDIPPEISKLTKLTKLYLYYSDLDSLPREICYLTNLKNLDLSHNKFKNIPPEIGKLINLTELELYNNQLESLPSSIGNLTKLTNLRLADNQLTDLPSSFGNLTNLTKLDLSDNRLTSLPSSIGNLTNLTSLDLENNQLASLPSSIGNLTNLTRLDLSNNQLASLPIEIGKLMIHINLSNNMLPTLIKMAEQDSIRIKNNTRKKNNIRIRTIVDKQPIKKQKRISYQEKEYVIVSIYDRKQVEDQNDNFKKHNNYLALWRNGFITKNNVYSFYIETKYEFTIYALILAGIVGGIIFYRKKRRLYQWLCWGIAGITVLAVVGLYGYLLLA